VIAGPRLAPGRDEFEEGKDLEVRPVEGREAADAGEFERRGESGVENPLSAEGEGVQEFECPEDDVGRRVNSKYGKNGFADAGLGSDRFGAAADL